MSLDQPTIDQFYISANLIIKQVNSQTASFIQHFGVKLNFLSPFKRNFDKVSSIIDKTKQKY